jgi:hypothetical protein
MTGEYQLFTPSSTAILKAISVFCNASKITLTIALDLDGAHVGVLTGAANSTSSDSNIFAFPLNNSPILVVSGHRYRLIISSADGFLATVVNSTTLPYFPGVNVSLVFTTYLGLTIIIWGKWMFWRTEKKIRKE